MDRRTISIRADLYAAIMVEAARRGIGNFSKIVSDLLEEYLVFLNKSQGLTEEDE